LTTRITDAEKELVAHNVATTARGVSASFLSQLHTPGGLTTAAPLPPDLGARVSEVERNLKLIKARMGNEVVSIGGMVFKSQADVKDLVINKFPSAFWSCFYNVVSFLECLSHTYTSWDKEMEHQYHASQGGHGSREEGKIAASFGCILPGLFRRNQGKMVDTTSEYPLPGLKDHINWNNSSGSNCLRSQILDNMDTQAAGVRTNIKAHFHDHPNLKVLSLAFLDETRLFINEIFGTYVEELYNELLATSAAPKKEAWLLVSTVIFEVFNYFYKVRLYAQDFDALLTNVDHTATIIWASCKCHYRMKELRDAHFRHHPLISIVLSNHLFKFRVPLSVHNQLEKDLKDKIKKLRTEQNELKSKVDSLVSKFSNLESKVNNKIKNN